MAEVLEELTPEQEALVERMRDEWLAHGLSCEPTDLDECRPFIDQMYRNGKLEPPSVVVLVDSPPHGAQVAAKFKAEYKKPTGNRWQQLLSEWQDPDKLSEFLDAAPVGDRWQSESDSEMWYLSHNAGWVGFYDTFRALGVLPDDHLLQPIVELSKRAGWIATYRDVCILQRRHTEIYMEDEELHREDGPAVVYADGFKVWAIAGVRVDEQIVMAPESQTLQDIKGEGNEERKRIRIERYGWDRYLTEIGAQVLDQADNDVEQTKEALMSGDGMHVLIGACPSTARVYGLEVPTDVQTCAAAQLWLRSSNTGFCVGAS